MGRYDQEAYEKAYFARMDRDRPKPAKELRDLLGLAEAAAADPSRLIEWQLASSPADVLEAVAADRWDRDHPFYMCRACKDGGDLPKGYTCRECGADNPGPEY